MRLHLTFGQVMNRLDTVERREEQHRKYFAPVGKNQLGKNRHRYADHIEPEEPFGAQRPRSQVPRVPACLPARVRTCVRACPPPPPPPPPAPPLAGPPAPPSSPPPPPPRAHWPGPQGAKHKELRTKRRAHTKQPASADGARSLTEQRISAHVQVPRPRAPAWRERPKKKRK